MGKVVVKEVVNLKWVRVKIKRGGKEVVNLNWVRVIKIKREVVKLNEVVRGN